MGVVCVSLLVSALFVGVGRAQERSNREPGAEATAPAVVVEAVRPEPLPDDPSSFATVIEMEEFRGEAKPLAEIIGDTVGVQVRKFGGPGDPVEISIRGSSRSQVVVLLDGVRINTAQSGGVDLSSVPVDLIERIEIVRGGGSVTTGSDAIGGVINIVTRRESAKPTTASSFQAGSFGSYSGSLSQTGAWLGSEFSLGYVGTHSDGDWNFQEADRKAGGVVIAGRGSFPRVNNESESHSGIAHVARDLGSWGRLRFSDSFYYRSSGEPGPDAGGGALLGQSLSAHQRRIRNVSDVLLEVAPVEGVGVGGEVRVFHRYDRSRFRDPMPSFAASIDSDNRNQSSGLRLRLMRDWELGPVANESSLGGEYRHDGLRSRAVGRRSRDTAGLFIQNESHLFSKRLSLIPALRVDYTQGLGVEWIPRFGLLAKALPWLHIKANVERSYRAPNFDELYFDEGSVRGNSSLEPEDAFSLDFGFELAFARLGPLSLLRFEFALFRNEIEESIVFQPISQFVVAATNTGDVLVRGFELAGAFRVFQWLGISGNWTRIDSELRGTGNPLPGRAASEYLLRAELSPPSRSFKIVAERSSTSAIPLSSSGGTRVSSRAVHNLSASIDLDQFFERIPGSSLRLSLVVNNVADVSVRDALFFPQPGRTLTFRIDWRR